MNILEIIQLRSTVYPPDTLSEHIKRSVRPAHKGSEHVTIYRRDVLGTDLAIHIYRQRTWMK